MDKVVKLVSERAGITESQAKTAVNTVASFLKERLPAGMENQVDNYLKDDYGSGKGGSGMGDMLGGMFDKK